MSPLRQIIAALLVFVGVQLWLIVGHGMWGRDYSRGVVAAIFVAALIPPVRRLILWLLSAPRDASPLARRIITVTVGLLSAAYFVSTAHQQGLDLLPRIHDESSYLIQTRMILHGRLWMPQHPLADFFESFHLLTKPVYASKYFPGAALLYAPGLALHLPNYWLPALAAGGAVALVHRIIGELIDGVAGAVAALMMLATGSLRRAAVLYIATTPLMLLVLLAFWGYLHWRRSESTRARVIWSLLIGFFLAWAGITRPMDAMCFAIPVGIAMLFDAVSPRRYAVTFAMLILGALPLLTIELIYDRGVTGSLLTTPWSAYTRHDDPYDGLAIGRLDESKQPLTTLPQKREFSLDYTRAAARERRQPPRLARFIKDDLPADIQVLLPHPFMMILLPVGLLAIASRGKTAPRAALYATLPLTILGYAFYTFSVPHYVVIAAPAVALGILGGVEAVARTWSRFRDFTRAFLLPSLIALCLTQLPEFNRFITDDMFRPGEPKIVADALSHLDHTPAVVLFRYNPGINNPHYEAVYNTDVAWPDDAPIIRAHDLGPQKNTEIFRYYAQRQPERFFYLFDRRDNSLHALGFARELAQQPLK